MTPSAGAVAAELAALAAVTRIGDSTVAGPASNRTARNLAWSLFFLRAIDSLLEGPGILSGQGLEEKSRLLMVSMRAHYAQRVAGVSTMRPPLASCRMKPSMSSTGLRQGAFSNVSIVSR